MRASLLSTVPTIESIVRKITHIKAAAEAAPATASNNPVTLENTALIYLVEKFFEAVQGLTEEEKPAGLRRIKAALELIATPPPITCCRTSLDNLCEKLTAIFRDGSSDALLRRTWRTVYITECGAEEYKRHGRMLRSLGRAQITEQQLRNLALTFYVPGAESELINRQGLRQRLLEGIYLEYARYAVKYGLLYSFNRAYIDSDDPCDNGWTNNRMDTVLNETNLFVLSSLQDSNNVCILPDSHANLMHKMWRLHNAGVITITQPAWAKLYQLYALYDAISRSTQKKHTPSEIAAQKRVVIDEFISQLEANCAFNAKTYIEIGDTRMDRVNNDLFDIAFNRLRRIKLADQDLSAPPPPTPDALPGFEGQVEALEPVTLFSNHNYYETLFYCMLLPQIEIWMRSGIDIKQLAEFTNFDTPDSSQRSRDGFKCFIEGLSRTMSEGQKSQIVSDWVDLVRFLKKNNQGRSGMQHILTILRAEPKAEQERLIKEFKEDYVARQAKTLLIACDDNLTHVVAHAPYHKMVTITCKTFMRLLLTYGNDVPIGGFCRQVLSNIESGDMFEKQVDSFKKQVDSLRDEREAIINNFAQSFLETSGENKGRIKNEKIEDFVKIVECVNVAHALAMRRGFRKGSYPQKKTWGVREFYIDYRASGRHTVETNDLPSKCVQVAGHDGAKSPFYKSDRNIVVIDSLCGKQLGANNASDAFMLVGDETIEFVKPEVAEQIIAQARRVNNTVNRLLSQPNALTVASVGGTFSAQGEDGRDILRQSRLSTL